MEGIDLFTAALGIELPWYISEIEFRKVEGKKKELHIILGHETMTRFEYEGKWYPVYDHQPRLWKHLNFFEHECYLHARVPRVKTQEGKVKLVQVPWAYRGSSFTLLFEDNVKDLISNGVSASGAGKLLNIGDKRVFGIIKRQVSLALANQPLDHVKDMSVDEVSSKKGHNYLTIISDRGCKKVVGVAVGKDESAMSNALIDMQIRGADKKKVRSITMDMSRSYIAGARNELGQAEIIFDRFHITKLLNEAVDKIRRQEQAQYHELKRSRYLWLRNNSSLNKEKQQRVAYLSEAYPTIGLAYRCKELFKEVMDDAYRSSLLKPINEWMKMAWNTGLEPIMNFVNTLRKHWFGIKSYFKRLATNAFAERVNLKIQDIKRVAKGYRNTNNFRLMIYFHLGGLDLKTHYK